MILVLPFFIIKTLDYAVLPGKTDKCIYINIYIINVNVCEIKP